jgi:hypothetical protein
MTERQSFRESMTTQHDFTFNVGRTYRSASEAFKDANYSCALTRPRPSLWTRLVRFIFN